MLRRHVPLALLAALLFASATVGAQGGVGWLSVESTPAAHVIVDGTDTGKVTPVAKLELQPGDHKLTLKSVDGAITRTLGFKIRPGDTTKLKINL